MKKHLICAASAATLMLSGVASASDATDAITAIGTEAASMAAAAWPVVASIVTIFVSIKLFKKFANKGS